jgi:multidrug resistance efflux pump
MAHPRPLAEPRPWRSLRLLGWLGGVLLVVSLLGAGWGLRSQAGNGTTPPSAETPRGVCFGFGDVIDGVAKLYPVRPGRVVAVKVRDNAVVKKNDPLFLLDDTEARADLDRAEAALQEARVQQEKAELLVKQHGRLVAGQEAVIEAKEREIEAAEIEEKKARAFLKKQATSQETVDLAEKKVAGLKAALKAEKAKLDGINDARPELEVRRAEQNVKLREADKRKAQLGVDECTVKAPADGTVLRMLVSAGETLGPNPREPAVYFCPEGPRVIRAEIEQEFVNRFEEGQAVRIEDDTRPSWTWTGRISRLGGWYTHRRSVLLEPLQLNDVRTLECIVTVDPGQKPEIKIGQRVRIVIPAKTDSP